MSFSLAYVLILQQKSLVTLHLEPFSCPTLSRKKTRKLLLNEVPTQLKRLAP